MWIFGRKTLSKNELITLLSGILRLSLWIFVNKYTVKNELHVIMMLNRIQVSDM